MIPICAISPKLSFRLMLTLELNFKLSIENKLSSFANPLDFETNCP
uniref:Uncharacterized protein n=1 Tax=Rhizophora mucronata TaxID=61149 RepID=A0A2P2PFK9_RHIMU